MPRLKHSLPSYRLHRASGQAVVTLSRKDHYLGEYDSAISHDKYRALMSDWLKADRTAPAATDGTATINTLLLGYLNHAERHYANESSNGRVSCIRLMMRPVKRLYGDTLAAKFGPLALQSVREAYIDMGWSRRFINDQVVALRGMFKWAVSQEIVSETVWAALKLVDGLRKGKTAARETEKIRPVDIPVVLATLPHISRHVGAMIRLQLITGARPGEIVRMRGREIDRSGKTWNYTPAKHKTEHHGHDRHLPLGPRAQAIILPFLSDNPDDFIFSPRAAEAERRAAAHAKRKTPISCGNKPGTNTRKRPQRTVGAAYKVGAYYTAIERACERAFPPPPHLHRINVQGRRGKNSRRWETADEWRLRLGDRRWAELQAWQASHAWHPHQLRHTAATEIRRKFGIEAAQVILGHATLKVTELYAERNVERAVEIMAEVG